MLCFWFFSSMIDLCSYKTLSIITGLEPATIQEEAAFLALLLVGTGSGFETWAASF
tara:strand:- start:2748 stop:2915 length:168 start_codon:yes stop_codon:yes gene_type:complete